MQPTGTPLTTPTTNQTPKPQIIIKSPTTPIITQPTKTHDHKNKQPPKIVKPITLITKNTNKTTKQTNKHLTSKKTTKLKPPTKTKKSTKLSPKQKNQLKTKLTTTHNTLITNNLIQTKQITTQSIYIKHTTRTHSYLTQITYQKHN